MNTDHKTKPAAPLHGDRPLHAEWPNTVRTRSELDAALADARTSGPSPLSPAEVIATIKAKHAARG